MDRIEFEKLKGTARDLLVRMQCLVLDDPGDNITQEKARRKRVRAKKKPKKEKEGAILVQQENTSPPCWETINKTQNGGCQLEKISSVSEEETALIFNLLSTPQEDWKTSLVNAAIERGLLRLTFTDNEELWQWSPEWSQNEISRSIVDELNGRKVNEEEPSKESVVKKKKRKRFLKLDESINELIRDESLHISLSPYRVRSEKELDGILERFATMLVSKNLGTIKEAEIARVNRNSFVRTEPEVLIKNRKLTRCAFHGDIVRVFVFKKSSTNELDEDEEDEEESGSREGESEEPYTQSRDKDRGFVIKVVQSSHSRHCTGSFLESKPTATNLVFMPHDTRVFPIQISLKNLYKLIHRDYDDNLELVDYFKYLTERIYEVRIDSVNSFLNMGNGSVIREMGMRDELVTENDCLLIKHGFNKFDHHSLERMLSYVDHLPDDSATRLDLTERCIFTIDPPTAKDLDDAVSCRELENGNVEVGVHISDVSFYVLENSPLDATVRRTKTTSVYMVDQVYHMLPDQLCQLCSLLPGKVKRAVSVFLEMTPDAQVVRRYFCRSLINSCAQLAYGQAQNFIEGKDNESLAIHNDFKEEQLKDVVLKLHTLATKMRKARFESGALKIDKPKYYFLLDDNKEPVQMVAEESKESNHLIEEFMLLANQEVAEYIHQSYPSKAVLRQHNPPDSYKMSLVRNMMEMHGFPEFRYKTSKEIADSMKAILGACEEKGVDQDCFQLVFNAMVARPMNRAQYFVTGDDRMTGKFNHFALSIPIYTHFTSPIRRYPDILVHRLLIRAMTNEPEPHSWNLDKLIQLMATCNKEKINARYCGDDSAKLFFRHFLKRNHPDGLVMRATVCSILNESFEVKLLDTGDEIICRFSDLIGEVVKDCDEDTVKVIYYKDDEMQCMTLKKFSPVRVSVHVFKDNLRAYILTHL